MSGGGYFQNLNKQKIILISIICILVIAAIVLLIIFVPNNSNDPGVQLQPPKVTMTNWLLTFENPNNTQQDCAFTINVITPGNIYSDNIQISANSTSEYVVPVTEENASTRIEVDARFATSSTAKYFFTTPLYNPVLANLNQNAINYINAPENTWVPVLDSEYINVQNNFANTVLGYDDVTSNPGSVTQTLSSNLIASGIPNSFVPPPTPPSTSLAVYSLAFFTLTRDECKFQVVYNSTPNTILPNMENFNVSIESSAISTGWNYFVLKYPSEFVIGNTYIILYPLGPINIASQTNVPAQYYQSEPLPLLPYSDITDTIPLILTDTENMLLQFSMAPLNNQE